MTDEGQQQQALSVLAFGDSLTAGYYADGQAYHPYAIHLTDLFESVNIPVKIDERGVSGECVVPSMVDRLQNLFQNDTLYNWVVILGGTNDLSDDESAEKIFKEGLEPMYDMCLSQTNAKTKLAILTVIENAFDIPMTDNDGNRQTLNTMIRNYVMKHKDLERICLVDLDKDLPYHGVSNDEERQQIWDDAVHLTPAGYDRMATLIFNAMKSKL